MSRHAAFLRAINVGGRSRIKMDELRETFAAAGADNVSTFLQSGNVLFDSPARDVPKIVRQAQAVLQEVLDHTPEILPRTVRHLERLVKGPPFTRRQMQSSVKLYVVFLARKPRRPPDLPLVDRKEALETIAIAGREVFILSRPKQNGFYGFPNAFVEEDLGVPATSRNWSTLTKLVARAQRDFGL
ncbi:MAG: DUF1697 domain-containing protein [Candidatus Eisenbacteria bacterium]|nr:DUF1697 domain-containing protein [Candidatus Eisenbacteria bacterium]